MAQAMKRSHQREAIVAYLKGCKNHPTAENIYIALKEEMPNLSLGTVYRNLALLTETGQILKLNCDGKTDHYDAEINPHYHVLCTGCGAVCDLQIPYNYDIDALASDCYNGAIDRHSILFHGICADCLNTSSAPQSDCIS